MGKVAAEIQQTREFPIPEAEAAISLLRTAELCNQRMADLLRPHGITPQQYNVLRILRGAAASCGVTCSQIGERMVTRDPDITRMLDRLQKGGLIERQRSPEDRRVILTRITPRGLQLLEDLEQPSFDLLRTTLGTLPHANLLRLIELLDEARDSLR